MTPTEFFEQSGAGSPTSIPRTTKKFDFAVFPRSTRDDRSGRRSGSRASLRLSENKDSEGSQTLFMTSGGRRRKNRSISIISNKSARELGGLSAKPEKSDATFEESKAEEMVWNIIDREIFEWQYVCRTGRPFWWSPESKYSRIRRAHCQDDEGSRPHIWMRGIEDRPRASYCNKRRAISDNYLSDPSNINEMAQMIAVQLLSACFTLPPDRDGYRATPEYTTFGNNGSPQFPDQRMISSLRMHTQFRYSPSFGHQARNTSPVQTWPTSVGNTSLRSPSPPSYSASAGDPFAVPFSGDLSGTDSGQKYARSNSRTDEINNTDVGYGRRGFDGVRPWGVARLAETSKRTRQASSESRDGTDEYEAPDVRNTIVPPKRNYRLQPIIRSEPHPVFVQPVKELVVKRWRTFRRRFGGSLHSPLPTSNGEAVTLPSPGSAGRASPSPILSNDGKERRLRAQERGDIHSSSIDSTPHYNTPVSGQLSSNASKVNSPRPFNSATASPCFQLADPLAAAAALALVETPDPNSSSTEICNSATSSSSDSTRKPAETDTNRAVGSPSSPRSQPIPIPPRANPSIKSPSQPWKNSPRRSQAHQRRKSMLSEVHLPEDFTDDTAYVEKESETSTRNLHNGIGSAPELSLLSERRGVPPQHRDDQTFDLVTGPSSGARDVARPRMSRTSTSGTQIFHSSADTVEIDGLPAGPSRTLWDGSGRRRDRSFL